MSVSVHAVEDDNLKQLQQSFFAHLLGQPTSVDKAIESTIDRSAQQRLHIYASGYRLRLKEAIATDFDRLFSYLGDELFEQLMDAYVDRYQSTHPSLRYYSQHMLELIATQAPFSDYPELHEIAQIEQAFNASFDAANCTNEIIPDLAQIEPEAWATLTLEFQASLQLIDLKKNSFAIWKALSKQQTPPALESDPLTWVIWRQDLVSRYRALSEAETEALKQALNGADFSEICAVLMPFYDEQQVPVQAITFLQSWLAEKMICQFNL